jgi:hypothetical protein
MTPAAEEAPTREDYVRRLEAVALALRPGFEAGEYRGDDDRDVERWDPVVGKPKGTYDPRYVPPMRRLENAVARRLFGRSEGRLFQLIAEGGSVGKEEKAAILAFRRRAAWILLSSPSAALANDRCGPSLSVEALALDAAICDVLRIARERGWYKPHPSEDPSDAELRGEGRRAA